MKKLFCLALLFSVLPGTINASTGDSTIDASASDDVEELQRQIALAQSKLEAKILAKQTMETLQTSNQNLEKEKEQLTSKLSAQTQKEKQQQESALTWFRDQKSAKEAAIDFERTKRAANLKTILAFHNNTIEAAQAAIKAATDTHNTELAEFEKARRASAEKIQTKIIELEVLLGISKPARPSAFTAKPVSTATPAIVSTPAAVVTVQGLPAAPTAPSDPAATVA